MSAYSVEDFVADCMPVAKLSREPADCVDAVLPLMRRLLAGDRSFLQPAHYRSDPTHYARNAIHVGADDAISLFAIVWLPGQWTPVHDHGTWGVVGVLEGMLEERAYMAADGEIRDDHGIRLKRGGAVLLCPGSISSFVPNPDHIHMTGVPADRERCVSLHLYGRNMNAFHVYDVAQGTRRLIDVPHQRS